MKQSNSRRTSWGWIYNSTLTGCTSAVEEYKAVFHYTFHPNQFYPRRWCKMPTSWRYMGGVGLTMMMIRRDYWIPRLRQLTKKVIRGCFGCKKFHVTAFQSLPPGQLPIDRTIGSTPFQVLGVDYAGPIPYKISTKRSGKAHILLFACSLTRAIHLELLNNQGFVKSLKRFIARCGRPQKIYSDNGKRFVAAARSL